MKKISLLFLALITILVLTACAGRRVSEVVSIELEDFTPERMYAVSDNIPLSGKTLRIDYSDGSFDTPPITTQGVSIAGNGIDGDLNLLTSTVGEKEVRISYEGVTITFSFIVYTPISTYDGLYAAIIDACHVFDENCNNETVLGVTENITITDSSINSFKSAFEAVENNIYTFKDAAIHIFQRKNITIIGVGENRTVNYVDPSTGQTNGGWATFSILDSMNISLRNLIIEREVNKTAGSSSGTTQTVAIRGSKNIVIEGNDITMRCNELDQWVQASSQCYAALSLHGSSNTSNLIDNGGNNNILIQDNLLSGGRWTLFVLEQSYGGNNPQYPNNDVRILHNTLSDTLLESNSWSSSIFIWGEHYQTEIFGNTFESSYDNQITQEASFYYVRWLRKVDNFDVRDALNWTEVISNNTFALESELAGSTPEASQVIRPKQ